MPQLMPLNWISSSMMMLLILMSISLIYSKKGSTSMLGGNAYKFSKEMNVWCW